MSSSEGVWAFLIFKQYDTHKDLMGMEFWGWVGRETAMSSRSSQIVSSGSYHQQYAAHLSKYIGTSSNILMPIPTAFLRLAILTRAILSSRSHLGVPLLQALNSIT